ncbi:MAG TPA: hypothetical protein VEB66_17365 [Opitutaceae bacterium]|nr:hypothetical protein [Opitutaceae bacterium]
MGFLKLLLRNIVAALAGAILAMVLIAGAEIITTRIYPAPEGVTIAEAIATRPVGAFIAVLIGYFVGIAAGAWLAARISVSRHARQGMMVGVLFFAASLANLLKYPHPVWFWVGNLAVVPLAAWLGMHFGEPDERPLD